MEIRISKPSRVCHRTEREFEHGEKVVSTVRLEDEHFVRQDFAEDAWEPGEGQNAVAVWSMAYHDPRIAEQQPPESFSPLRQIFYESVEGADRESLATAYLAAELLRRQRVFKLLKQSDDPEEETKIALYNDKIGNRLVEVRDPNLLLSELEAGRKRLVARLQQLEGDPEEEAADSVAAADGDAVCAMNSPEPDAEVAPADETGEESHAALEEV